jgi:hypothetical protein
MSRNYFGGRREFVPPSGDRAHRHIPSPLEQQNAVRKHWHERGFADHRDGKEKMTREALLEIGGELALRNYFAGWRAYEKVEAA